MHVVQHIAWSVVFRAVYSHNWARTAKGFVNNKNLLLLKGNGFTMNTVICLKYDIVLELTQL